MMKSVLVILAVVAMLLSAPLDACDRPCQSGGGNGFNGSSSSSSSATSSVVVNNGGGGGSGTGTKFTIQGRKGNFVAGSIADGQAGQVRSRKKRTRINVGP